MENWATRGGSDSKITIFCLGTILWGIWNTRNKYAIEGIFPKQPLEVAFKINHWLLKWQVLLKEGERLVLGGLIECLEAWVKKFQEEAKKHPVETDFM